MRTAPVLLAGALLLAGCGKSDAPPTDDPVADSPATGESATDAPAVEPTAAMGEQIFRRCVACHTVDKGGRHGIGPNLHGIVGAPVAAKAGFSYSGAMKAKGGVWDEAALDAYLKAPMKDVPGTRMAFAGVVDATDRKALILYLQAQK
ncbi:c-type cytochrome [Sphingopyxis alaskensis]|jgi:cytochrome c|uniref:Cytochrome c, class I n=1 Tax=Sphingopyxis alaskensis (strain DSM 13593 / LMG 18877 / RB2256) TaxID=317655 RepID=Q1GVI1_SPHAL|nr:cytochrome c family protein [Sphingopyxis alaskensis]ABF52341.1 cytochrome c, class I [Sphingopyxis alaskensis RB2256]MCM3420383.1 cytochrome c family protein [Sphingopyxis alaskensis]